MSGRKQILFVIEEEELYLWDKSEITSDKDEEAASFPQGFFILWFVDFLGCGSGWAMHAGGM